MKRSLKTAQIYTQLLIVLAIVIVVNVISNYWYTNIDLTEDQRFTFTPFTYNLLEEFNELKDEDDQIQIDVYLEGNLPSEYQRLQNAVVELLDEFRSRNPMVTYRFINPIPKGTSAAGKDSIEQQLQIASFPVQGNQRSSTIYYIYPSATVRFGKRIKAVSLLDNTDVSQNPITKTIEIRNIDEVVSRLEYRFANALRKVARRSQPRIAILSGHGEEPMYRGKDRRGRNVPYPLTYEFQVELSKHYSYSPINLDSTYRVDNRFDLLIIAKPKASFGEIHMFMIDQYIMNGGKVLWLMDGTNSATDSLRGDGLHVPQGLGLDVYDMIQNYGVRVNQNLVLSYDCGGLTDLQTGSMGIPTNQRWWYYPSAMPYATPEETKVTGEYTIQHPIVKGLEAVEMRYASSLDTMKTMASIKKTILLRSSEYSKLKYPPTTSISFGEIDPKITNKAFRKGHQNLAVLLEGSFYSNYRNRVHPDMKRVWESKGQTIVEEGKETKMIVVGDGDLILNGFDRLQRGPTPMGYGWNPQYGNHIYANFNFLFNCIEYLLDDTGIMTARSKNVKLRPLKQDKAYEEKEYWQLFNLVLPAVSILLLVFGYWTMRKYKYER
ncbi:MAG: gliding motility-associated ABC transporter substrate-binding protein GldG [Saprospiraceae bacterium]|nr:gliding motility-associated ABC transporter substrate-binding protein GldG [Saprospiraceae bacterium]